MRVLDLGCKESRSTHRVSTSARMVGGSGVRSGVEQGEDGAVLEALGE